MSQTVTLDLPDPLAQTARSVAARTNRPVEEVLLDWLDRAATDAGIDALPDDQVLALRDLAMSEAQQEPLSDPLERPRESALRDGDRARLDELLSEYRRGLVRKAKALKVAVERGLQAPLDAD